MCSIIVVKENEQGEIKLTKEELQQMIDRAYAAGQIEELRKKANELKHTYYYPIYDGPYTIHSTIPTRCCFDSL